MPKQKRTRSRRLEYTFESLENRSMLACINAVAPGTASVPAIVNTFAHTAAWQSTTAMAKAASPSSRDSETHLTAMLTPTGQNKITGFVAFETETHCTNTTSSMNVTIKGGTAASVLTVSIQDATGNAFALGTITVAADGTGQLTLSSNPHGTQQGFPANMPTIAATTVVSLSVTDPATKVSTVLGSGSLAKPTRKAGGHETGETNLIAVLNDSNSTLTGSAQYEIEKEHGATVTELGVRLKGAKIGAVIDVTIVDASGAKVSVGQITVAADGTGRMSLSSNPIVGAKQSPLPTNFPTDLTGASIVLTSVDPVTHALTQILSSKFG